MTKYLVRERLAEQARIVDAPGLAFRHEVDRTFELPKALYGATVALYLGFVAVMAAGFGNPGMILPTAIFVIFIIAGFTVPALWTKLSPGTPLRQMRMNELRQRGIATLTGRLTAGEAAAQMLILPIIIFAWAVAAVTISVLVS